MKRTYAFGTLTIALLHLQHQRPMLNSGKKLQANAFLLFHPLPSLKENQSRQLDTGGELRVGSSGGSTFAMGQSILGE